MAKDPNKTETQVSNTPQTGGPQADTRLDPQASVKDTKTGAVNDNSPEKRAEESGDPVFFEGTIVKLDKDGNEVMSDHLMPGERLRREDTEDYLHSARSDAHENAVREREDAERAEAKNDKNTDADTK